MLSTSSWKKIKTKTNKQWEPTKVAVIDKILENSALKSYFSGKSADRQTIYNIQKRMRVRTGPQRTQIRNQNTGPDHML